MFQIFFDYLDILMGDNLASFLLPVILAAIAATAFIAFKSHWFAPKHAANKAVKGKGQVISKKAGRIPIWQQGITETPVGRTPETPTEAAVLSEEIAQPIVVEPAKIVLGTGAIQTVAIRNPILLGREPNANILDFTTMPYPVGEAHYADTSCPFHGGFYTVQEGERGEIIDYDSRGEKIEKELTPDWAYDSTHPPDVAPIFNAQFKFWKQTSFWICIVCLIICFFIAAQAMGA
jgi:hypothetical protein